MARYMPPAEKIPRLTRLKSSARNRDDVLRGLKEIGGPSTTKEYSICITIWGKLRPPAWREAADLIDEMARRRVAPDIYCYSAAISACSQARQWQRALELFNGMEDAGVTPNEFHYSSVITACAKCNQADVAMKLFEGIRARGVQLNAVVYNSASARRAR